MAKMTKKTLERSKEDKMADRMGAMRRGVSVEAYEGSPMDKRQDRRTTRKMEEKKGKKW